MYEKPVLKEFGEFRDLTLAGWAGVDDHMFFQSVDGCNLGNCIAGSR